MFDKLFKKTKYIRLNQERTATPNSEMPNIPDGFYIKCKACGKLHDRESYEAQSSVCSVCGHHFRVRPLERIEMITDEGTFVEMFTDVASKNPLDFEGYEDKVSSTQIKAEVSEAVTVGTAEIQGRKIAVGVMDPGFMMGSMGSAVGERITCLVEHATKEGLPVIIVTASGGARMQEGIFSLMQMAKTSMALKRHSEAGLLYVSILTDPTTGGVTASFAMLGDIILAEPGALIGFAGPRVIEQTIRQKLPEGFQRSEFLLEHGFIDKIVKREDLYMALSRILSAHKEVQYA
ncbi:acetyl-CoA carboxylase, carboxyltransferase subunit beta [Fusibacter sp. JL216-2]|uniref:acetyl-CoA carboxylase, carboxyltransferase subunit beta n=1 Tax=Fusibacter sp. JL216-2 TaxID=3071453 RepID=UPI003D35497F